MFNLFKKNSSSMAMVKYAENIDFLYSNLKEIENLKFEEAKNNVLCLTAFYIKELLENPMMDHLNVNFKCLIPKMYGWRWVSVAYSSAEIQILLFNTIERFNLKSQYEEIAAKGPLFYEYENSYK